VVKTVLHAMRTGDTAAMRARFHSSMPMRVPYDRNGVPGISVDSAAGFIAAVARSTRDQLDERVAESVVHIDGNLAQVWAYYEFVRGGAFSHCGADQFVLGRTEAGWKLLSLSYSVRTDGCRKDLPFTPRERALRDVVAAERAFAHYADTANLGAAFVWALRDDAIYLDADGVKQMKPVYAARPAGPAWLRWVPSWVDAAADGSMGLTTGPYAFHRSRDAADSVPIGRGDFMTIWVKGADRWQVALDQGIGGDTTAHLDEPLREQVAGVTGQAALPELMDVDKRIRGDGWLATLKGLAVADVRVLREGTPRGAGRAGLTGARTVRFTPLGGRVAASGDIGATWGTWVDGSKKGAYVRFWRRTAEGWRVTVDRLGD